MLQDDSLAGRGRACTCGDTHANDCVAHLCVVCAHLTATCQGSRPFSAQQREGLRDSTRHLALECPRAALLLDALARAYAAAVGWSTRATPTCQSLLREVGAAMVTGYQGGEERGAEPFRAMVAAAAEALTGQWGRQSWEGVLCFWGSGPVRAGGDGAAERRHLQQEGSSKA